jgi:hypothetical protein
MKSRRFTATIILVAMAVAPLALAQTPKPKKKGAKAAASASASASAPAPDAASASAAAPDTSPPPTPSASAAPAASELPDTPPLTAPKDTDTLEDPLKAYYFFGARYRGTLIPQFLVNAFAQGGGTFFSNMAALELDIRKDGHSTMPWLAFANYGFGNTLFESNGSNGTGPEFAGNWTVVNSSLNAIYAGLDELWSAPLDEAHHWDFEYGFGVGLGVVFGTLGNNWVHTKTGTQISNNSYVPCVTSSDGTGCAPADHNNPSNIQVEGNSGTLYSEPAGLLGPKPILFPYVALPEFGVRYKPVKQFEGRFDIGFSLTGFWFGLSVDYGLEKTGDSAEPATKKKASQGPGLRGSL